MLQLVVVVVAVVAVFIFSCLLFRMHVCVCHYDALFVACVNHTSVEFSIIDSVIQYYATDTNPFCICKQCCYDNQVYASSSNFYRSPS